MNIQNALLISAMTIPILIVPAMADPPGLLKRDIPTPKNTIVFSNDKGEVVFSHKIHSKKLNEDDCILCHRTDNPTRTNIMSRFDNPRIAHYFCKGCHRETGNGPTECHECHNYRKKKP